ncbi:MAG: hypothetical protein IK015_10960 [Treponema sp.]|nr:hypothetical protein [Treponema sp.]
MKKRIVFLLLLAAGVVCNAQQMKFYSDYNNGYQGWAGAVYDSSKSSDYEPLCDFTRWHAEEFAKKYNTDCYKINKLTNEHSFLMWSALNEYNYKIGEVYGVIICTYYGGRYLYAHLCVNIVSSDRVKWVGYQYSSIYK